MVRLGRRQQDRNKINDIILNDEGSLIETAEHYSLAVFICKNEAGFVFEEGFIVYRKKRAASATLFFVPVDLYMGDYFFHFFHLFAY